MNNILMKNNHILKAMLVQKVGIQIGIRAGTKKSRSPNERNISNMFHAKGKVITGLTTMLEYLAIGRNPINCQIIFNHDHIKQNAYLDLGAIMSHTNELHHKIARDLVLL